MKIIHDYTRSGIIQIEDLHAYDSTYIIFQSDSLYGGLSSVGIMSLPSFWMWKQWINKWNTADIPQFNSTLKCFHKTQWLSKRIVLEALVQYIFQ